MYKIIGADGKEYGPITVEQLRQWISEGRVNPQTRVKSEGATGWQPLGSLPEFAQAHAALTAPPPRTSALAITSLILGVLGFCGVTALVGLILGIVSLVKISGSQGRLNGKGLAIAGICVSAAMLLLGIPLMAGLLLPAFAKAKGTSESIRCLSNARRLQIGVMMFEGSHTNQFPAATNWCASIRSFVGSSEVFLCREGDKTKLCHYAFNANLDGINAGKIKSPATTVVIFETDGGWNLSGGGELMISKPRHRQGVIVAFADGHAEMVKKERLSQLRWLP